MSIIDHFNFTHPLDQQALASLQAIPGFTKATKAIMRGFSDRQNHLQNMSSKILLGPNQVPDIYNLLAPVCERLGIEQPPLYIELDPNPNAYTRGDNLPEVTLTSGLLDYMNDDEVQIIMAHECGHIVCHHVLYSTIGSFILGGSSALIDIPFLSTALSYAYLTWMRSSEFSADRAAVLYAGDPKKVAKVMMRLAGCAGRFEESTNIDLFMKQAAAYEEYLNDNGWNKFLGTLAYMDSSHPLNAVRASQVLNWTQDPTVQQVIDDLDSGTLKPTITYFAGSPNTSQPLQPIGMPVAPALKVCPKCAAQNDPSAKFCSNCGTALPESTNTSSVAKFCPNCGVKNETDSTFCPSCGTPLNTAGTMQPVTMPQVQMYGTPYPNQKPSSTDKIRNSLKNAFGN